MLKNKENSCLRKNKIIFWSFLSESSKHCIGTHYTSFFTKKGNKQKEIISFSHILILKRNFLRCLVVQKKTFLFEQERKRWKKLGKDKGRRDTEGRKPHTNKRIGNCNNFFFQFPFFWGMYLTCKIHTTQMFVRMKYLLLIHRKNCVGQESVSKKKWAVS